MAECHKNALNADIEWTVNVTIFDIVLNWEFLFYFTSMIDDFSVSNMCLWNTVTIILLNLNQLYWFAGFRGGLVSWSGWENQFKPDKTS